MSDIQLIHSCGVPLQAGDYDSYKTVVGKAKNRGGTKIGFHGFCPVCEEELHPEDGTDAVFKEMM